MPNSNTVTSLVAAVFFSLLPTISLSHTFHASQAFAATDWQAEFLEQAPSEYKKLEAKVGRSELRYTCTYIYYPGDGTLNITHTMKIGADTMFDDRLGGMKATSYAISNGNIPATRPSLTVDGRNPEYAFTVDSEDKQPFLISNYAEIPSNESNAKLWREQLENYRGMTAEDFDGTSLLKLIKSGEVKVKSAGSVEVNGKSLVRFVTDRSFQTSKPTAKIYAGWVIIDPAFHWAVQSYEQYFLTGGLRRSRIKYNPSISDVAFPKQIIEEDYRSTDKPLNKMIVDFEDPKPTEAVAKDFTLQAFGLERPGNIQGQTGRRTMLITSISGAVAAAFVLFLIILFHNNRKRLKSDGASGENENEHLP